MYPVPGPASAGGNDWAVGEEPGRDPGWATVLVTFLIILTKTPDKKQFKEGRVYLAHGFRAISVHHGRMPTAPCGSRVLETKGKAFYLRTDSKQRTQARTGIACNLQMSSPGDLLLIAKAHFQEVLQFLRTM